jgi:hypothetical protein
MSEIKVDTVVPRTNPSTLTIGAAGDTINIAGTAGTGFPAGTTINNNADNRVITGSGTSGTLNGETNFTYDGTDLILTSGSANSNALTVKNTADATVGIEIQKSDYAIQLLVDHDNAGAKNFAIRRESVDGSTSRLNYIVCEEAGEVTKPQQPAFKITQTGALSVADGHTLFSTNTTEVKDIGSNWASGTFTAPVDGFYYISASILYESISSAATDTIEDTFVMSNGNEVISRGGKLNDALNSGGYFMSNNATIAFMDENDTCKCVHTDGSTLAVHPNSAATHFEGYLLG